MFEIDLDDAKVPEIRLLSEMMRVAVLKDQLVRVPNIRSVHCPEGPIEADSDGAMPGRHEVAFTRLGDKGDREFVLTGRWMN